MSWWTQYLQNPKSVNKLQREQVEDLYFRAQEHLRQLTEQEASLNQSTRENTTMKSNASMRSPHSPRSPSQSQTNTNSMNTNTTTTTTTIYASTDKRVAQLVKTINSLNADRNQVQKEIQILLDMLAKINANINKERFTPGDLLYSYTFENAQMKSICANIIDLNNQTTDENDHEDYLFILDLFSENTLQLLQRRIDKTRPQYEQRLVDFEDDIASLTAEKQITQKQVEDLQNKINIMPSPESTAPQDFNDLESVLNEIDRLGDTATRLNVAKRNLEALEEQKMQLEQDLMQAENIQSSELLDINTETIDDLRDQKQNKLNERKQLQSEHDDLQRYLMELNDKIKRAEHPHKSKKGGKSDDANKPTDLVTRLQSFSDFQPDQVKMVWDWSQSTRLEDLLRDIDTLQEHKDLLIKRRDSLKRKIEQLIALNANLDMHIQEYNKVIQDSQKADNE